MRDGARAIAPSWRRDCSEPAAFAAFPAYLAMRGAPTALRPRHRLADRPILLSWFLSRTGRYEARMCCRRWALRSGHDGGNDHRRHRSFAAIGLSLFRSKPRSRHRAAWSHGIRAGADMRCHADRRSDIRHVADTEVNTVSRIIFMASGVASATLLCSRASFGAESLARPALRCSTSGDRIACWRET